MAANAVRIGAKGLRSQTGGEKIAGITSDAHIGMEDKDLSKCETSSSEYKRPCKSPRSITHMAPVVEELTLINLRKPNSVDYSLQIASGFGSKDSQGDSTSQDNDQMLLKARSKLTEMHSGMRSLKPSSSNPSEQDPDNMLAYVRARNSKIISSNMLSIAKKQLKTQSTNSHSQSLVKETWKGKGISKIPVMDQKVSCGTRLKSVVSNGHLSSLVLDRSRPESISSGMCLRELLEPGRHKVDIVERLIIFRRIVELVDFAHCQGVALQELRPSCFILLPSNVIRYTGATAIRQSNSIMNRELIKKRLLEHGVCAGRSLGGKQRKLSDKEFCIDPQDSGYGELQFQKCRYQNALLLAQQQTISATLQLEEKWYTSPEDLHEMGCTFSSNIYGLGVLLFEVRRDAELFPRVIIGKLILSTCASAQRIYLT